MSLPNSLGRSVVGSMPLFFILIADGGSLGRFGAHAAHRGPMGEPQVRKRTSFRRFWAVAASRNSYDAPVSPRNRKRRQLKFRLRCANTISAFLRS